MLAVLVTLKMALRGPGAVGVKRTLTTQPFPAGVTLSVQPLPAIWKSPGSCPTNAYLAAERERAEDRARCATGELTGEQLAAAK